MRVLLACSLHCFYVLCSPTKSLFDFAVIQVVCSMFLMMEAMEVVQRDRHKILLEAILLTRTTIEILHGFKA